MKKNWSLKKIDYEKAENISKLLTIDKYIASILAAREITDPADAYDFINPNISKLHSPFIMHGMIEAVERIKQAITSNETVGIFADSDLDGITSLTILYKLLSKFNVNTYLRYLKDDEQYGLTNSIIDEFKENNAGLIITVDSGTRDISEIDYANSLGVDVIISDHHEQDHSLPDAIVVNPKIDKCNYPFKDLAGVGVTFKLCQAVLYSYLPGYNRLFLIISGNKSNYTISFFKNNIMQSIKEYKSSEELIDIISSEYMDSFLLFHNCSEIEKRLREDIYNYNIFIISDLIFDLSEDLKNNNKLSLDDISKHLSIETRFATNESEILNKIFLEIQLRSSEKINSFIESTIGLVSIGSIADIMPMINENRVLVYKGFKSLRKTSHPGLSILINNEGVNTKKIGWDIAPLLNTPGRFGMTELTVNFFLEDKTDELKKIVSTIKDLNKKRKDTVNELCQKFVNDLNSGVIANEKNLLVIKSDLIPEGLAGLIANRLSDETSKPVIAVSLPGKDGIVKGSGRHRGEIDFISLIKPYEKYFEKIGGHSRAFGFTIKVEVLDSVMSMLTDSVDENTFTEQIFSIDLEVEINKITEHFIKNLSILEPHGPGNEEPVFLSKKINIESFARFGENNRHGKFNFKNNPNLTAIGWNIGNRMEELSKLNEPVDILFTLENNYFKGVNYPRMIILDIN